ncbi:MAG: ABC transporter permease subunit [Thermoanaerobaculia bacterium]|nr:ABC transporter permease subunit [Thermoanaerobaculia bacterium]
MAALLPSLLPLRETTTATMHTAAAPKPASSRTSRRRLVTDRLARLFVSAGGLAIIASILGILIFLLVEVMPLTRAATVTAERETTLPVGALAIASDEYRTHAAVVGQDGRLVAVRLADGHESLSVPIFPPLPPLPDGTVALPPKVLAAKALPTESSHFVVASGDGRLATTSIEWRIEFNDKTERSVHPEPLPVVVAEMDPERRPLLAFSAHQDEANVLFAAQLADRRVVVVRREGRTNAMTGEVTESFSREEVAVDRPILEFVVDHDLRNLYAGTATGELLWWSLADGGLSAAPQMLQADPSPVTALSMLIGDRALVVGQQNGALSVWLQVRQPDESIRLTRVRDFERHTAAVTGIAASERNKGFLVLDEGGGLGLYHSTAHRTMWRGTSTLPGTQRIAFTPKDDGALVAADNRLGVLSIRNPHPETTWKSLFGRVWYEGYDGPEFSWQSTGGTDDFEPKLSLTPLLVGTLKGTFFSLILAIPLGVLGAMFASQFMHPRLLRVVKPTVEIMAALPSVVLGFIAGLWLAPLVERHFPALLLAALVLPLMVLLTGLLWRALPLGVRNRFLSGSEVGLYVLALALGVGLCFALAPGFERLALGGDYRHWLLDTTGLPYDQRNAIVVGLAMGFAVIPIIFAISEDAFSNVPRNLVSGSLALGANRWQTVTRVVLPTASPGIFSAIMIGFGRAVGETMIVLMATGNTPIMSWNPFNGFRTLSANIAVEIPEAPQGGTLYRTLFLAALLLFALTFVVNTIAEIVRQRLRRRYSEL